MPALRCPGGPRIKAEGVKHLYKVPHAGFLAKYDQRFVLNLKLTHQIVSHLSRRTLRTPDKLLIELGPGVGALTRSLLTRPCVGVLAVECDERFNAHLEQIRSYTNGKFQWVNADVLHMKEAEMIETYYPAFARQHKRRPPPTASQNPPSKENTDNHHNHHNCNRSNHKNEEESGFEGAPLRSSQRDRLLRQRQARQSAFSSSSSTSGASTAPHRQNHSYHNHSYEFDEENTTTADGFSSSPNPALDVTDHWWSAGDAKIEVVANLPFSVITELLLSYAVDCSRRQGLFSYGRVPLHIFAQREVAERMTAAPGSLHFSKLSVLLQAFFHVRKLQTFTEWTYYPKTEVMGTLLTLEPRALPLGSSRLENNSVNNRNSSERNGKSHQPLDGAMLIHFTDLLMQNGHRGATIHKSLSSFMPPEVVQFVLQSARMDGALTVLDLSVEELVKMAALWARFLSVSQQQQQQ